LGLRNRVASRSKRLDPLFDASQHVARHQKVSGNDEEPAAKGEPPWCGVPSGSKQEASPPATVDWGEHESPRPVKRGLVPLSPTRRQMGSRMQCQCHLRLEALNNEATPRFGRSVRDEIAEVNLLQSWDNPVCTGPVRREQQLVNPASRVPAGPMPAHLHKPGPDGIRRCADGDGVIWSSPADGARCHPPGIDVRRSSGVDP
jgi:hypothetical protein